MFHEPPAHFLYSAYRLDVEHRDSIGTSKTGSATAFVLATQPGTPWLVTNRHVIDLRYRETSAKYDDFSLTALSITGRRSDDSSYTFKLHPDARLLFHSDAKNDVVMIEPRICFDGFEEGERSLHWHFGLEHLATQDTFAKSVRAFDLVCYAGFPDQYDRLGNRPILRSGYIASDPNFDYSWDRQQHGQCVAYEGFSFSGSSGSPVYAPPRGALNIPDSRNGFLVGVNAGHVPTYPNGHSGISYFYKSTVLLDIIRVHNLA